MSFDPSWTSAELAHAVCDNLVASGKLKEKPAFIRGDREVKIAKIFESVGLSGAKMGELNARGVEVAVRNATEGEAWVDDVQATLRGMLSEEAAASMEGPSESEELKAIKAAHLEKAREEFKDGAMPLEPGMGRRDGGGRGGDDRACFNCGELGHLSRDCPNPGSGGGGGGYRQDDEAYASFGSRRGGSDLECYNCGERGHMSRDCPSGGAGGGGGYGGDRACYNCGETGHLSRDCPTGGGRGGQECFNCGQTGHISRDCPEPDRRGGGGGGAW